MDKKITKLLLKDYSCNNCTCKFSLIDINRGTSWCTNRKKKPENNICIVWEKSRNYFNSLDDYIASGCPRAVPNGIIVPSSSNLISRVING